MQTEVYASMSVTMERKKKPDIELGAWEFGLAHYGQRFGDTHTVFCTRSGVKKALGQKAPLHNEMNKHGQLQTPSPDSGTCDAYQSCAR